MDSSVRQVWEQLSVLMQDLEVEVEKNVDKQNVSAGIRLRKGLRQMKKVCSALVKLTTEVDKQTVAARREENKKVTQEQ